MNKRDKRMAVFWVLLGLTISIWSATFPMGGVKDPGPALLPLACGLILMLLGVILLVQKKVEKDDSSGKPCGPLLPGGPAGRRVALTLGGMLLSAVLFVPLGFALTVFLLILFLMRTIQPQKWNVTIVYAFLSAAGSFLVFKVLLKSQLPSGLLGF